MKINQENNLVSWDDHLDKKYGKMGTLSTLTRIIREGLGGHLTLSLEL